VPLQGPPGVGFVTDLIRARHTAIVFSRDGQIADALDETLRALEAGPMPFATAVVAASDSGCAVSIDDAANPRRILALDVDRQAAAMYGALDGAVYLVRPDGHVAGRWQAPTGVQVRAAVDRSIAR
jgi:3-(3-hydroxy-phenyl)propionate hydroxylase